MDHFHIIFVVVAGFAIFIIWKGIKAFATYLKKFKPNVDTSAAYLEQTSLADLPSEIDRVVKVLEEQRIALYHKTKGLFKRALLRTWFVSSLLVLTALYLVNDYPDDIELALFIAPLLFCLVISLISAGIYTLVRKHQSKKKFANQVKTDLVTKIVKHINSDFSFTETGIERSSFDASDLFLGNTFSSEDSINGHVEGQKVTVSECHIQTTVKHGKDNSTTYVYFNGLFVELELANNQWPALKVITQINVENERKNESFSFSKFKEMFKNLENPISNQNFRTLKIHNDNDKVLTPVFEGENYSVFGLAEAEKSLTPNFHKVIDFILAKFDYRDVFVSIRNGRFYLAICWNQNMFDSDNALKESLLESDRVKKMHQDLLFINQIVKEVSLMNKL